MSSSVAQHDTIDPNGGYQKRCYCQKCTKTYDQWCRKKRDCGETSCKRKCYTVCEYKCSRPTTIVEHWGWKKQFDGKWEKTAHVKPPPKVCPSCGKASKECACQF